MLGGSNLSNKRFMKGNEAIGEAAIRAGCMAYYGYPITPQNELTAYMAKHMPAIGRVAIQTESEIAAINCTLGSATAGFRAMTSSAGTAMCLKQEGISQAAYWEVPIVVVDVSRGGPGMGNILQSQTDYRQATKGGGNGDYHNIVLVPNSVQEAVLLTRTAFDLADKYRNGVIILIDGTIGQMMELVELEDPIDPSDLPEKDYALNGCRGRKPNKNLPHNPASDLEEFNIRLQRKYDIICKNESRAEVLYTEDADIIVTAYGSVSRMAREMVEGLRAEGYKVGLFRPVTAWPFPEKELNEAVKNAKAIVSLEHGCGMYTDDIRMNTYSKLPVYYHGRIGGNFIDVTTVAERIKAIFNGKKAEWGELNEQQGLWKTYESK